METNAQIHIQAATFQDESLLWLMLTYAAWMESGGEEQIPQARSDSYLRAYVSEWGVNKGDLGVIARAGNGDVFGAAWLCLGCTDGPYNLGDKQVPELATAVVPRARRRGVGTAMMKHLTELARPSYPRIILSVREENPAVLFYSKLGFREVSRMENRVGGSSLVMTMDLAHAAREQDSVGGIQKACSMHGAAARH